MFFQSGVIFVCVIQGRLNGIDNLFAAIEVFNLCISCLRCL